MHKLRHNKQISYVRAALAQREGWAQLLMRLPYPHTHTYPHPHPHPVRHTLRHPHPFARRVHAKRNS